MKKYFVPVLSFILMLSLGGMALGYQVVDVKDGAAIKGVVKFKGTLPADETVVIDKNVNVCGKEQKLNKYLIKDSMVKNTVVFIEDAKKGKALPRDSRVEVTINKCRIEPFVSIGFVGGNFVFRNDDDILHTLQTKLWLEYQLKASSRPVKEGATIYNLALPHKGKQIEKPIKAYHKCTTDTGVIKVTSNSHPWMRGYAVVLDHPYAAVTDDKGVFSIDNLLPGEYTLKAWHEGFGWQEKKIKLGPKEVSDVEIVFEK